MKQTILFLVLYFLFINWVSTIELGISPGEINFKGVINERICREVYINTNYKGELIGNTRWINKNDSIKNIQYYKLNPEYFELEVEYSQKVNITNESNKLGICVTAKKPGKYHGAIIYTTQESYAGVGSWITLDIRGNETKKEFSTSGITGGIIGTSSKTHSFIISTMLLIFVMLLLMLIILLYISKKMNKVQAAAGS